MKVTAQRHIRITLTEKQAEELCALLGGVCGGLSSTFGELFCALDKALPNRVITFSDLEIHSFVTEEK